MWDDGHFGLLYVSAWNEVSSTILVREKSLVRCWYDLLEASSVELIPISYATVETSHMYDVESFSELFEICPL